LDRDKKLKSLVGHERPRYYKPKKTIVVLCCKVPIELSYSQTVTVLNLRFSLERPLQQTRGIGIFSPELDKIKWHTRKYYIRQFAFKN
jgi:hypothetical protein